MNSVKLNALNLKKKNSRPLVYDSDDECDQSNGVCDAVEVDDDESNVVCDAVQVNAVDSGIGDDEYVRQANTEVRFEIMPGKRQSSRILYTHEEKQIYLKNSNSTIGEGWKCYYSDQFDCRARLHVRNGQCFIANSIQHTGHARPDQEVVNMRALNDIKAILRSVNNRLPPLDVFNEVIKR